MRDLSNFKYSSKPRLNKRKLPVKLIGVLALLIVIFLVLKFGGLSGGAAGSSSALHEAPRGLTPIDVSGVGGVADKGVNLKTQKAVLSDVKYGGRAKGTATRSFGGGSYVLSVDVTLVDTSGASWEIWLADDGGLQREVDFMNCAKNTCSYTLRDSDKYSNFNRIWITRELTKEDNAPEQHILEGEW